MAGNLNFMDIIKNLEGSSEKTKKVNFNLPDSEYDACITESANSFEDMTVRNRDKGEILELVSKSILSILPEVEIQGTNIKIDSFENMLKRAGNGTIIINNPNINGSDLMGTPLDPRMGTIDNNKRCSTCRQTVANCPGHYGFIRFTKPRLNPIPEFIKKLIRVLNSVGGSCGMLKCSRQELEDKGILRKKGEDRLIAIERISKDCACNRIPPKKEHGEIEKCSKNLIFLPKESLDNNQVCYRMSKTDEVEKMSVERVFDILDSISDEDSELMGFAKDSHPRDLVLRGIPVIPLCSIPNNVSDGKSIQNDLTKIYIEILKEQKKIDEAILKKKPNLPTLLSNLDNAIARLIGVDKQGYDSKKALRSVKKLLSGKGGLIRKNIQGKRTDHSGRTVLSTDPNLKVGQIGIPEFFSNYITRKETVTQENIGRLTELLKQDKIVMVYQSVYPGSVHRKLLVVGDAKNMITLKIGDQVERSLQNGDWVIYYRNPTISMQSMMAGEVVISHDRLTIDIPMDVTKAMNADFDGDELNIHAVQTEDALKEISEIMVVKNCIISKLTNSVNLGIFQDALSGTFLLTQNDTFIEPEEFLDYIKEIIPPVDINTFSEKLIKYSIPLDSGRALFSATLPPNFFYTGKGPLDNMEDVVIQMGLLFRGVVSKYNLGRDMHNTIIQALIKDYGSDRTLEFMHSLKRICYRYMAQYGFTIGVKECLPEDDTLKKSVGEAIEKTKFAISSFEKVYDKSEIIRQEKQILAEISNLMSAQTRIIEGAVPDTNNLRIMAMSGGNGATSDIGQISGMVGQQLIDEGRPIPTLPSGMMDDELRCLPIYDSGDLNPESRGLCTSSYSEGFKPGELYFNAATSRVGVLNTQLTTSVVGTFYRYIVKSLEDIKINKDNSVISAKGIIVSGMYGNDGLEPSQLETVKTDFGMIPLFANVKRLAGKINNTYGYIEDLDNKENWISK